MTIEQTIFFLNEIRSNNNCDETIEQGSPTTQLDAQHAKNLMSGALGGTDYADRLRWLLSQAERVVTVDAEDRRAVDKACKLLKQIDNGFDRVRG